MTAEEAILGPLIQMVCKKENSRENTKRVFMSRVASVLVADASDTDDYKVQLLIKKAVKPYYTSEDLAYAYIREFGDGESYEEILKQIGAL